MDDDDLMAAEWADPTHPPDPQAVDHGGGVWSTQVEGYVHGVWVWHYCNGGWNPGGVGLHTLLSADPLSLWPSVYWKDCCGKHGFLTDGVWREV